ncbi:MAG: radical SAM family heme chaperone HemW [Verrucomicrobia bacterium]|nr:MAG: radical SAM family heme chaperone HemW [Verrucomicrobiota bacterium]
MAGLYLHIPFCESKCVYCGFYSLPLAAKVPGLGKRIADFFQALEKELAALPVNFAPDTLFIGGGTPTALSQRQLENLLGLLRPQVRRAAVREWTVEVNPGTLTPAKADLLRASGMNRASLGVQTLDDAMLERLGRIHTAADARMSFELLRTAGFENVSVDLMYALPGKTTDAVLNDLHGLLAWQPDHISCYALTVEPDTPLAAQCARGAVVEVPDEVQAEQYHAIRREMKSAGFQHYEISNFARPGRECLHNLNYWRGGEYFGCGPAAHAHVAGRRRSNIEDLDEYCRRIANGRSPCDFEEQLAPEAKARETLIVGLRLLNGVELAVFRQQTGFDALALGGDAVPRLLALELLELESGRLRLTERSLFISDRVFAELV